MERARYPMTVSLMHFIIGNVEDLMILAALFEICSKYLQSGLSGFNIPEIDYTTLVTSTLVFPLNLLMLIDVLELFLV